jgi:tyrosine-protein kinase Etk/Wzc
MQDKERAPRELGLIDAWEVLRHHWKIVALVPLLAGIAAYCLSLLIPPTYTAVTTFLPPNQQQSSGLAVLQGLGSLGGLAGGAVGIKNPGDQYVAFLRSYSIQNAIVEELNLKSRYDVSQASEALSELDERTKINSGKDGLIKLEVDDREPIFAAKLANLYIKQLDNLLSRLAVTDAQRRRMFYERQLKLAQDNLTIAQQDLQRSGIREGTLRAEPRAAAESYASLRAQITAAQIRLEALRTAMTESATEIKAAVANISSLKAEISKSEGELARGDEDGYISKYRTFKYQEVIFEMLVKQLELAKLDEAKEGALIQVVDEARPPDRKSKPKKGLIAIAAASSMLLLISTGLIIRRAFQLADQVSQPRV